MGHNRVESVGDSGIGVAYAFNGGTMDIDCLLVLKGSPNTANAMKLINDMIAAEPQARLAKTMPLGPVNTNAFSVGILSQNEAVNVNTHPMNYPKQLLVGPQLLHRPTGRPHRAFRHADPAMSRKRRATSRRAPLCGLRNGGAEASVDDRRG